MADKSKAEISPQKRSLKLAPMIGDWTTYKPSKSLTKKVKLGLYGFDRLSGEELKQAHLLHYNFAARLIRALKEKLRLGTELYLVEAYQNTYASFLKSSSMPVFQGKVTSSSYNEEVFVSFDMQMTDSLINAALGSDETAKLHRGLTEAEEIVLSRVLADYFPHYYDLFKEAIKDAAFLKVGSPDITIDSSINPQSTFVYFSIDLSINGNMGRIIFGYSGLLLKNILKDLNKNKKAAPLSISRIPSPIFNSIKIPVSVSVGGSILSMAEIHNLELGDVVPLEQKIEDAVLISLSNKCIILGQPGKKEGKTVVRIVGFEKEKSVKVGPPIYEQPEIKKELQEEEIIPEEESLEGSLEEELPMQETKRITLPPIITEEELPLPSRKGKENLEEKPEKEFEEEELEEEEEAFLSEEEGLENEEEIFDLDSKISPVINKGIVPKNDIDLKEGLGDEEDSDDLDDLDMDLGLDSEEEEEEEENK
ncbi:hypothetical protein A3J90_07285 [candidate division WOR-1 bacterium RIFOXYC2_FULL_37_10]|uniref:Flagellar motor switch protein FliM n=1 Tax=candidate division WOR-1 bacterium RIFOXYB2_FULL_37_13 TaxID=1802579 RepID=A0A1F4SEW6_UNCSA|nr:MAG: hypothetical protein A2310_06005 [candidate division WOR-1 bacterium RIFOXYB2_FULL_37_13]OGC32412.1 MAG: hypothetical protein A3J90_07285 [candidate division WOR-1 bacterium RIFOXYC2_FULL_37_10]